MKGLQFSRIKETLKNKVVGGRTFMSTVAEVARDDPRRVIHSFKVGVALSFVSLLYYYKPLYDDFGVSSMWAVMTVLAVSEFSVGATLGKGITRGVATLLAGALGLGTHHVANRFGHVGERVVAGFLVFLLAVVTTFMRFIPKLKARYEHGLVVFVLTFSFVSVSGYGVDEMLEVVRKRVSTIMIGASVSVVVSMALLPVWAGEDLHDLVAANLEKLGDFMEEFGDGYFEEQDCKAEDSVSSSMLEYKSILNSKNSEESLAGFARWEPGHGRFKFSHPWKQYLQIGTLARECAYRVETLNRYLAADVVRPRIEVRSKIKEPGKQMSIECGRALKQMSVAMKAMCLPCAADPHIESAKSAAKALNSLLNSGIWQDDEEGSIGMLQVAPVATVATLLADMVNCVENIGVAIYELASGAEFRRSEKFDGREVLVSNLAREAGHGQVVVRVKPDMVSKA